MNSLGWKLALFIILFAILALGLITLALSRSARDKNRTIPFAITYGLGVTVWLASLVYISFIGDAVFAHRVSFAISYAILLGILGLAVVFPNSTLSKRARAIFWTDGIVGLVFISLIFFTDKVIAPQDFYHGEKAPLSLFGTFYLLVLSIHLFTAVGVSVRRYRREIKNRLYFNYIVFAFIATSLVVSVTNIMLPLLGITSLAIVGPIAALLPFAAIVYSLGITDLNDIRFIVAQVLHVMVRLVLATALLVGGYVAHKSFGLEYYSLAWIISVVVIAVIFVTGIYALGIHLDPLIDRKIVYSGRSPEMIRNQLIKALSGEIELQENVSLIGKSIKGAIGVQKVGMVLNVDKKMYRQMGDFELSQKDSIIIHKQLMQRSAKDSAVHLWKPALVTNIEWDGLQELIDQKLLYGIMPMHTRTEIKGFYVLGYKFAQGAFTKQDISLLNNIVEIGDLSIERAMFYDKIRAFSATLQQEVADTTRHLRESNRKLKLLDETKDDFISMASHQLRTPLTSVKGYISLVLDGDAGPVPQSQRKLLTQAYISSQRMVFLIADLLNVSRLRTGKFVIEPIAVNLADLVDDEVAQLVETAESRSLTLTYHKPAHFPVLQLDETKTRQVIMNFIDNAIYYTPAGGHINVQLLETPRSVELRVVDDGMGVPKTEQHHLFTKFYRAKNAQKARPDGTGLGLFMAKKVIVAQGGAIIFTSQEGQGSTFGFSFAKDHHAAK